MAIYDCPLLDMVALLVTRTNILSLVLTAKLIINIVASSPPQNTSQRLTLSYTCLLYTSICFCILCIFDVECFEYCVMFCIDEYMSYIYIYIYIYTMNTTEECALIYIVK